MGDRIPVLDLTAEVELLWGELNAALQDVLRSGQYIMGESVLAFEGEAAEYLNVKHAVAVNSGTDALVIGLRALNIGPGDEVITSPFTFFATAEAISLVGATPVFVDIDPRTFNLDVEQIPAAVTGRTRAVLPVHLYGQPVDLGALMRLAEAQNLVVLEDSAQAFGAEWNGQKAGTFGRMGAFSFFPSKNLGAYGDAGMIVTCDDGLAETARMLRAHGAKRKYYNEILGYNSRMDSLQAAILRVKLPHVDEWNLARRAAAARYTEMLSDLPGILTPVELPGATHVYHQYTIRLAGGRRDVVRARLGEAGIHTMVYYPVPVHRLPYYAGAGLKLPHAEAASAEVVSLPIWPLISAEQQRRVAEALRAACSSEGTMSPARETWAR